jgi:hypothetical protein
VNRGREVTASTRADLKQDSGPTTARHSIAEPTLKTRAKIRATRGKSCLSDFTWMRKPSHIAVSLKASRKIISSAADGSQWLKRRQPAKWRLRMQRKARTRISAMCFSILFAGSIVGTNATATNYSVDLDILSYQTNAAGSVVYIDVGTSDNLGRTDVTTF